MRKHWEDLSPAYRKRLERAGITARSHARGESLTRARGHFAGPVKHRGLRERERLISAEWNRLRYRAKKLQAYESIRLSVYSDRIRTQPEILRKTVEFFEALEAEYAENGEQGSHYVDEYDEWYNYMLERYPDDFLSPNLDFYYHGDTKG